MGPQWLTVRLRLVPAANNNIVGVDLALVLLDKGCVAHDETPQASEVCIEHSIKQYHRRVDPRITVLHRSAAWMLKRGKWLI